ncbi:MAG TPA: aminotransferase class III-fold pyridoxal phosphate-dependent enzyme, partial [Polyangiaceae bacterium]
MTGFSEIPAPPEHTPGDDPPFIRVRPPGPQSRSWLTRHAHSAAPMGLKGADSRDSKTRHPGVVLCKGQGSNVLDVDGNRYVDLAGGFGAQLLGHRHPSILRALEFQATRLTQALGEVLPSDAKVSLVERLAGLYPERGAQAILAQSGSDAVTAALKTAALHTGLPGVIAFSGAYHGLGYAPLAACGLRPSYLEPFRTQLNPRVRFVEYPRDQASMLDALCAVQDALSGDGIGAILVEPILGRGGCIVPPEGFVSELGRLAKASGAVMIADEIWTGLGRSGKLLFSGSETQGPDLICLGKGL